MKYEVILNDFFNKIFPVIGSKFARGLSIIILFFYPRHSKFFHYGFLIGIFLHIFYYVLFGIVAFAVFEKVFESAEDDSASISNSSDKKAKDVESYLSYSASAAVVKDAKKRDIIAHVTKTWGLHATVGAEVERLVDQILADFINPWFDLSK
jgi:hypothetical protein